MITVVGLSPSIDITYLVDDLRLGRIHRPTQVVRAAGGKSLNMARAAHRQGADVALVGVFGGGSGEWLAGALREEGVGVHVVPSPAESRTCVSIASDGELTEVYEIAPPIPGPTWESLLTGVGETLPARPGWLVISGSTPAGLPATATADLVDLGHAHGVSVAVDTSGPSLRAAVERRPELLKVNRDEAADVLGVDPTTDLGEMLTALAASTGGRVVLTDGAAGAVAGDGTAQWRAVLDGVRGHYPVGSGDSFLGGLVAGLDRRSDLTAALRVAMACGAANALEPGAAVYGVETVARLLDRVAITPAA